VGKTTEEKVLIAEENLFLAARSELERKRKAKHEVKPKPRGSKNPKASTKKYKTVTLCSRVLEFPNQPFRADPNCIFCLGCKESSIKIDCIKEHIKADKHINQRA
jgi:hypothetical protein